MGEKTKATIVTVEEMWGKKKERRWGPLSRATAWRVGIFCEDLNGDVKVFLDENGERKEAEVEKRIERGRARFFLKEKTQHQQEGQERRVDEQAATVQENPGVDEVPAEEIQMERMMWLAERTTSIEKENEGMKLIIREMESKIALHENTFKEMVERHLNEEAAIAYIADHIQRQDVFNESAKSCINGLVEEVKNHQDSFRGLATILQIHDQHIAQNGAVSQQMAQYVNALIEENEKKTMWIGNLMRESQAQTEVLRQHHLGQHALAGVIKGMMNQQTPQQQSQQTVAGTGPTVTVVDDEDGGVLNFRGGQNPQTGPPDIAPMTMELVPVQLPKCMEVVKQF